MSKTQHTTEQRTPDNWWSSSVKDLLHYLDVDPDRGLTSEQVESNRQRFGCNQWEERGPTPIWVLLWDSVKSPMMLVLFSIAGISLLLGQIQEAVVMAFVVAIYIGVHLLNKARSDRTMARLREVQAPTTTVLRDGEQREIDFINVVVGDILPLRSGSRIPADARLVESAGLLVNESTLTGESAPVRKAADADISADIPLAERKTAVFASTTALDGQGKALVMAVGSQTELGRVAELATRRDQEKTPLQKEMDDLASTLAYVALGVSLLIPLIGLLLGFALEEMVLTWLSLTFLMVPGQPPIIIAMALALAALELARKHVIVRRLYGAETLGSVNVVLSDKTGTMTENQMRLVNVLLPEGQTLAFAEENGSDSALKKARFMDVALASVPETSNDPTDLALVNAGEALAELDFEEPGELVDLSGFSRGAAFRRLTYQVDGVKKHFVTGRLDVLLDQSAGRLDLSGERSEKTWDRDFRDDFRDEVETLAAQGKRITAYALGEGELQNGLPQSLYFAGAAVIDDPIRPEVPDAVTTLSKAGVRTVMITGDTPQTAAHIAQLAGLETEQVIIGHELDDKDDREYEQIVKDTVIFARTTPEQKLKLVEAYQRSGETVAVTGDGINDAPALNAAHIGVAMGEKGTDVARESADLVLTDDNFARLPDGVAIGRKAYDNFRKGITYYLSAKAILLTIFIVPLFFGIPFPLAPIQIIFTELLMDLASSTIFISETAEPDVMDREPRKRKRFLSWDVGKRIARNMAGLTIAILIVYFLSLGLGRDVNNARTAAFSTWLLGHIILAFNLKQEKTPLFKQGLFSNTFAVGWLLGMIAFVLAMTHWPFVQSILNTTALQPLQWVLVVAFALLASMWMEVVKWIRSAL